MKKTRVILQKLCCDAPVECNGSPTPYASGFENNEIGEHCLDQSPGNQTSEFNKSCRYLKWKFVREIDTDEIDISEKGRL